MHSGRILWAWMGIFVSLFSLRVSAALTPEQRKILFWRLKRKELLLFWSIVLLLWVLDLGYQLLVPRIHG